MSKSIVARWTNANRFLRLSTLRGLILVLAFSGLATGQKQAITTEQLIEMSKAGLPEDVIIARIQAEPAPLRVSPEDLILLKKAGVSDGVIRALVSPAPARAAEGAPLSEAEPEGDPNDPAAQHDPGVYLYTTGRGGKPKMEFIDQMGAGRERTHRGWLHDTMNAELPGARAAVRTADAKPVFYMYFSTTATISDAGTILSPTQFSLVAVEPQKDHRETVVERTGLGRVTNGTDEKKAHLFDSQRIRPHVYKVTPNEALQPGEYAFIATTSVAGVAKGATVVIYDFGVDAH